MIRACHQCGQKNRIPSKHLADIGRCGKCKAPLPPIAAPIAVNAAEFDEIAAKARLMGFRQVVAGPFVRSSYHADEMVPARG